MKREDGGPGRSVKKEYKMQKRVLASLATFKSSQLHVPAARALITPENDQWWDERLSRFPEDYSPCNVLVSERILPFSKAVRERLIDTYCPPPSRELIKSNQADTDCLIRVYLGRRLYNSNHLRPRRFFSLRNFPLHADQMEGLGNLDMTGYAKVMADGLAMMHWLAKIDANDVEFVIAPPRPGDFLEATFASITLERHAIWILDFDCCNSMAMDESGVDQAVAAFFRNDPYYPRPGSENTHDEEIWKVFRARFLETSLEIFKDDDSLVHLPGQLMNKIEVEGAARRARQKV
jgi:hypothetical protein